MDNRTIRRAIMRRCPEVKFVSPPQFVAKEVNGRKDRYVVWGMLAKIKGVKTPVKIIADMKDTALASHSELVSTMISEIYDEIRKVERGQKNLEIAPGENHPPLSDEMLKIFHNDDDIHFFIPGAKNVDPRGVKTDADGRPRKFLLDTK